MPVGGRGRTASYPGGRAHSPLRPCVPSTTVQQATEVFGPNPYFAGVARQGAGR